MRNYYRIILGKGNKHAEEMHEEGYIGIGFLEDIDLTNHLPENWREFNEEYISKYLERNPEKTKVSAGLACSFTWTVSKGILHGDIVLCPDGKGSYYVGEVEGDYEYLNGEVLPHRRRISWYPNVLKKEDMSSDLQNSCGAIGTVCNISKYGVEIDRLIEGESPNSLTCSDETVEDPSTFALEKHLEDFLVANWSQTPLGKKYDIFEDDGELVGEQYPSDTGPIDILAISKDKKELLVVELKKGRASDVVIGQIQRYMGYVKAELAEKDQKVRGIVIALDDDIRIHRALSVAENIEFYRYKVSFKLEKAI